MNLQSRQPEPKRSTGSLSGLVIAALGFQLLLCSAASAAHACTGTIDRIPGSVVHALREIVDRQSIQDQNNQVFEPGFCLHDCMLVALSTAEVQTPLPISWLIGLWTLDLPPPAMG